MRTTSRPARIAVRALALAAAGVLVAAPSASAANQGIVNPGFEDGSSAAWGEVSVDDWYVRGMWGHLITDDAAYPAHSGTWKARLGGYGYRGPIGHRIVQDVTIPAYRVPVLSFWMKSDYAGVGHRLTVEAVTEDGTRTPLYTRYNAAGSAGGYEQATVTLPDAFYSGTTRKVSLEFTHWEEGGNTTPFLIDDVSLEYRYKIYKPIVDLPRFPFKPFSS
ncbi:hypothetical protein [Kitasatospora camelliae]|uniref:Uncharacterized protein n=1 Tax=Kitasatospora camelliae TaxID=3156397 RepID=A0AAU8K414_9ACTN